MKRKSEWKFHEGECFSEITGLDCVIWIQKRPHYCDRGNFLAEIDLIPGGDPIRLDLNGADGWPRYYMKMENAKEEIELWMKKRKQWVE